MGEFNNPVPTKCWEAYLTYLGCEFVKNDGTHHKWKCPQCLNCLRSIIFWGHKKEVPRFHILSNLKTMGKTNKEFNTWIKENCK